MGGRLLEGPTMVGRTSDWKEELGSRPRSRGSALKRRDQGRDRERDPCDHWPQGPGPLPVHACLSRRPRALFHDPRARRAGQARRVMARNQERGARRRDCEWRDCWVPPGKMSRLAQPLAVDFASGQPIRADARAPAIWRRSRTGRTAPRDCDALEIPLHRHDALKRCPP